MNKIYDGGPAFPTQEYSSYGMSLRDYFAAAALKGLIASETETYGYNSAEDRVKCAYEHADAMLAERKNHNKEQEGKVQHE